MSTFLLEVGTEELPADFVESALQQWQQRVAASLEEQFLTPETVETYGTPRRLALLIRGLPGQQPDREEEIKGPPATAAFKDGKPTKAAAGFARKQGVALEQIEVRETEKGAFAFVRKQTPGRPAAAILQELAPQWIGGLEGRRFMRWADGDLRFPRPIRWLVALLDGEILPLELVNGSTSIKSDRLSWGHRTLHPEAVAIPEAADYLSCLRAAAVEVDPEERRRIIEQQIGEVAGKIGGIAEITPDLLAEVVNLLEYPTAIAGKFDAEFLSLPAEIIATVMVTHQRYFPVRGETGLLPYFITIANGNPTKAATITAGNERVIRARLADAQFFYRADCDQPLESYLPQLAEVTFQEDLGTMGDKVNRIVEMAQQLAEQLRLDSQQCSAIERTALLCKADLVTQMVYEFPELQGVMGQKYALVSGEPAAVAQGIFEHYLPRSARDQMPESLTGQVVGIADRLDTLTSIFGLGLIPTGSSDPFALRRAANAIVNLTWHAQLPLNLAQLIEQGAADFLEGHPDRQSPVPALKTFFLQRLHALLEDELGIDYDLANAVLGEGDGEYAERALADLLDVRERAQFLQQIRRNGMLEQIYETVNRSTRLAAKGNLDTRTLAPAAAVSPEFFEKPAENAFYEAILSLIPESQAARRERNYQRLVEALAKIAPTVSNFFDGADSVLVMDENPEIRQNRLNFLGLLRNHSRILADFGQIVKGL
jgi:glycyl-tRNA synthetase beta chain